MSNEYPSRNIKEMAGKFSDFASAKETQSDSSSSSEYGVQNEGYEVVKSKRKKRKQRVTPNKEYGTKKQNIASSPK